MENNANTKQEVQETRIVDAKMRDMAAANSSSEVPTDGSANLLTTEALGRARIYAKSHMQINNQLELTNTPQYKDTVREDYKGRRVIHDSGYVDNSFNAFDDTPEMTELNKGEDIKTDQDQWSEKGEEQPLSINDLFKLLSYQLQSQTSGIGDQLKTQSEALQTQNKQLMSMDSDLKAQIKTQNNQLVKMESDLKAQIKSQSDDLSERLSKKIEIVERKVGAINNTIAEMKTEISNVNVKVDNVQGQVDEINTRFDSEVINIQNSVEPIVKNQVDEKVFGLKTEILDECKSEILQINSEMKSTVTACEQKCERNTSQVQGKIIDLERKVNNQPSYVADRISTNRLLENEDKFDPSRKHHGWHPLDFIRNCERVFPKHLDDMGKINVVISALAGDAKTWGLNLDTNGMSFATFKSNFTDEFWSEQKQNSLWREFVMARLYDNKDRRTLREFCEHWYRKLTHLKSRRAESEIIWELWKKLPEDSKRYVGSSHKSFSSFLERVEDEDHWRSNRDYRPYNNGGNRNHHGDSNNHRNSNNNTYNHQENDQVRVNMVQPGRGRGRGHAPYASRGRDFAPNNHYSNESGNLN